MTIKVKVIETSGPVYNVRLRQTPSKELSTIILAQPTVEPNTSTAKYLEYIQNQAQTTWLISHNFGKIPTISVFDGDFNLVKVDMRHLDINVTQINFSFPFSGIAILTA